MTAGKAGTFDEAEVTGESVTFVDDAPHGAGSAANEGPGPSATEGFGSAAGSGSASNEGSGSRFDDYQQAVLNSRKAFCVTAGAGSGKTGTLVEYLLRFVETGPGNSLTQALVMTFSEKAAAELRERVAKGLGARLRAASAAGDAPARALWERELRRLGQSQISTIHSYALGLVTSHSHLLGLSGDASVDSEGQEDDLREVLDDLLDERHPDLMALLDLFDLTSPGGPVRKPSIVSLISATLTRQSAWGLASLASASKGPLPESGLFTALRVLREAARDVLGHVRKDQPWVDAHSSHQAFASMVELVNGALQAKDDDIARNLAGFIAKVKPRIDAKFGNLGKVWRDRRDGMKAAGEDLAAWQSAFDAVPAVESLVNVANMVYERVRARRLARGAVSFDDILAMARDLLRSRPEVRAREASRFRLVMVDEFQDTNRLQTDLLAQLLADPPGPAADWEALPWPSLAPKLKVVGDPKQSIYRFRGAEPGIMAALAENLVQGEGGEALPLSVNYRTQAPLVDFFNALFKELLAGQAKYAPQVPKRPGLYSRQPAVWLKGEWLSSGGLPPDFQAKAIVSYLRDLFSGEAGVMVADKGSGGREGEPRLPEPRDVAVLLRKKKNSLIYQEALAGAGWPCHTLKGRDWFESPEIRGLSAAYLYLAGREPDFNLALALTSPLGPVSEEALIKLAWPQAPKISRRSLSSYFDDLSAPWPSSVNQDDLAALEELRSLFAALKPLAARRPAGEIIEAIVEARHLLPLIIGGPGGGPERVRDVQSFMARVKSLPRTDPLRGGGEADLIEAMRNQGASRNDEDGADPGEDPAQGSINIMTVHGSKGLEFPIVIIPEADGLIPRPDDHLVISDDGRVALSFKAPVTELSVRLPEFDELKSIERDFASKESKRLLYVAATRARDHLVFVGKEFKSSSVERWLGLVAGSEAFKRMGRIITYAQEDFAQVDFNAAEAEASLTGAALGSESGVGAGAGVESAAKSGAGVGVRAESGAKSSGGYNPALIGPPPASRDWTLSVTRYCAIMDFVSRNPEWRERVAQGEIPPLEAPWEPSEALESDDELPIGKNSVGPSNGRLGPAERGTLFHAVMEATDFNWTKAAYIDELLRRSQALGFSAPENDELEFLASKAVLFQETDFGQEAAKALAEDRQINREWPFWLRLDSDELGPATIRLSGAIDLFYVDANGHGQIVDYKLTVSRAPHRKAYSRQLDVYRTAVRQAGFLSANKLSADLWYSEN